MSARPSAAQRRREQTIGSLDEVPDSQKVVCWLMSKGKMRLLTAPYGRRTGYPRVYTLEPQ